MHQPSVNTLFSTLLQTFNYEPPKELIDYCYRLYEQKKFQSKQRSIRLGFQSDGHVIDELQPILDYVDENTITTKLIHGEAWVNINPMGGYNVGHIHPNSDYTFVYYLTHTKVPIVLNHPHMYEQVTHTCSLTKGISEQYNMKSCYYITPKLGDILMFPSYVPHHVESNNEMNNRISISWNSDSANVPRVWHGER